MEQKLSSEMAISGFFFYPSVEEVGQLTPLAILSFVGEMVQEVSDVSGVETVAAVNGAEIELSLSPF